MKKIFEFFLLILIPLVSFSSCLEDEPVFRENGSSGIVELQLPARPTSTPYAVKTTTVEVKDTLKLPIVVNYTGVNGAPENVKVTIESTMGLFLNSILREKLWLCLRPITNFPNRIPLLYPKDIRQQRI